MSTTAKAPPITPEQYQAFKGFPGLRDELIKGEIVLSPQPKPLPADIARNVERILDAALVGTKFLVRQNVNFKMREENSMLSPDVFVLERSRWENARDSGEYPEGAPVIAVEIVSPANRKHRILQKVDLYLRNGSVQVWVIYPKRRRFEVHDLSGVQCIEEIVLPEPLPSVRLQIAGVFRLI